MSDSRFPESRHGHSPRVSVIICTYNRAHLLERTLRALSEQSFSRELFEVMVVDDCSDDRTRDVCDAWARVFFRLKYRVNKTNVGAAVSANRGIQSTSGKHILFTDDDCVPDKDWIKYMDLNLQRYPVVAGAVISSRSGYFKLCHNISQFHHFMPGNNRKTADFIAGANMGFRRVDLMRVGEFKNRIAPDTDLILRARQKGYEISFSEQAIVLHDPERNAFPVILNYSVEHAAATIKLRLKYRTVLNTPFVLKSPLLLVLFSPVIGFVVTASIYARNKNLVKLFWTAPVVFILKCAWCWGAAKGLRRMKAAKIE